MSKRRKTNGIRVIIPDSHGCYIDDKAADCFLNDLERLKPDQIVGLGDHLDCSGAMSKHGVVSVEDKQYAYKNDCKSANRFFDAVQRRAPNAETVILEGNHEFHVERWAAEIFNKIDAEFLLEHFSPAKLMRMQERGWRYIYRLKFYDGLSIPNTIKLGKCFFTHGICASKFATARHVERFAGNVVHGHTHRTQEHKMRTVRHGAIGGWCPGTLARLQPLYMHTNPTDWSHGYGVQFYNQVTGTFMHFNIPIIDGKSMLKHVIDERK